ncbi:voltage-gated chloride channel (ClcA) [Paracoccidioides lutzii Pb01]|uniref:Voltage-gated chloride channel (ClcA) n=1 Tax=Paracoccidioides lutzii (strain ATCC MYA-826 / Pb01) TaxID=502779 RepID=C1GVD8_PARBA|nr:voltage-gated chloride channel (ClcA) [Paracoccidioides lutzii Pb01]EEH40160.2 voltage-gated chloride channel (ClcA) [Paracoccidioides lutzii Pb01]
MASPLSLSNSTITAAAPCDSDCSDSFKDNPRLTVTSPPSPTRRRGQSTRFSEPDIRSCLPHHLTDVATPAVMDERTSLLGASDDGNRAYTSIPNTNILPTCSPRSPNFHRHHSTTGSLRIPRNHSRANSQAVKLGGGQPAEWSRTDTGARGGGVYSYKASKHGSGGDGASFLDDRVWYDQFTSTDWVHDSIADGIRLRNLRSRRDIRGRILAWLDGAQGWILVAVIGIITACVAYFVDVTETAMFDVKEGFCVGNWFFSKKRCCLVEGSEERECEAWLSWAEILNGASSSSIDRQWVDFIAFVFWAVLLAALACVLTMLTKTVVPSSVSLSTLDEDLGAQVNDTPSKSPITDRKSGSSSGQSPPRKDVAPPMVYFSAAGSGVAEVKVILSGFVLHGYLGFKTLVVKTLALVLAVASGLSVGKEGPYVHIAACIGNISCRIFSKYHYNDGKRREVLSASAAGGVGVAFGAPIGGVLFSLEEVSYYFPPKTLFRTFFCCIAAALSLKFLNPYGTGKIVLFEVRYESDWQVFELLIFTLLGVLGGAAGALFIKASKIWAQSFRRIPVIKRWPLLEVVLVSLITGLVSFWNRYTKLPVSELLFELASPCGSSQSRTGLCPPADQIPEVIRYLVVAFVIKSLLTIVTFGIKVPAGIYVPSMVVGGLLGRIVGHIAQYFVVHFPDSFLFGSCPSSPDAFSCVNPGVYALIAAGSTMCGVTRLSVTLVVILFELTGSLDHVLPFSLAILCAKWTADAMEPLSIYDLLTDMNSYPFLDNKLHPTSDIELVEIVPRVRKNRVIDISNSPLVPATELREKLDVLLMAGELDGGLPILRKNILVGLIPAPELGFALDRLENEKEAMCLMCIDASYGGWAGSDVQDEHSNGLADFTPYIDPAPVSLDIHSPISLVYQCFVKLGLRYMCVLRDGQFAGLVHKKSFVKFMKEQEKIRK